MRLARACITPSEARNAAALDDLIVELLHRLYAPDCSFRRILPGDRRRLSHLRENPLKDALSFKAQLSEIFDASRLHIPERIKNWLLDKWTTTIFNPALHLTSSYGTPPELSLCASRLIKPKEKIEGVEDLILDIGDSSNIAKYGIDPEFVLHENPKAPSEVWLGPMRLIKHGCNPYNNTRWLNANPGGPYLPIPLPEGAHVHCLSATRKIHDGEVLMSYFGSSFEVGCVCPAPWHRSGPSKAPSGSGTRSTDIVRLQPSRVTEVLPVDISYTSFSESSLTSIADTSLTSLDDLSSPSPVAGSHFLPASVDTPQTEIASTVLVESLLPSSVTELSSGILKDSSDVSPNSNLNLLPSHSAEARTDGLAPTKKRKTEGAPISSPQKRIALEMPELESSERSTAEKMAVDEYPATAEKSPGPSSYFTAMFQSDDADLVSPLNARISALEDLVKFQVVELKSLKSELSDKRSEVAGLNELVDSQVIDLESVRGELEDQRCEISGLNEAIESQGKEMRLAKSELEDRWQEVSALNELVISQGAELRRSKRELEERHNEINRQRLKMDILLDRIRLLEVRASSYDDRFLPGSANVTSSLPPPTPIAEEPALRSQPSPVETRQTKLVQAPYPSPPSPFTSLVHPPSSSLSQDPKSTSGRPLSNSSQIQATESLSKRTTQQSAHQSQSLAEKSRVPSAMPFQTSKLSFWGSGTDSSRLTLPSLPKTSLTPAQARMQQKPTQPSVTLNQSTHQTSSSQVIKTHSLPPRHLQGPAPQPAKQRLLPQQQQKLPSILNPWHQREQSVLGTDRYYPQLYDKAWVSSKAGEANSPTSTGVPNAVGTSASAMSSATPSTSNMLTGRAIGSSSNDDTNRYSHSGMDTVRRK